MQAVRLGLRSGSNVIAEYRGAGHARGMAIDETSGELRRALTPGGDRKIWMKLAAKSQSGTAILGKFFPRGKAGGAGLHKPGSSPALLSLYPLPQGGNAIGPSSARRRGIGISCGISAWLYRGLVVPARAYPYAGTIAPHDLHSAGWITLMPFYYMCNLFCPATSRTVARPIARPALPGHAARDANGGDEGRRRNLSRSLRRTAPPPGRARPSASRTSGSVTMSGWPTRIRRRRRSLWWRPSTACRSPAA